MLSHICVQKALKSLTNKASLHLPENNHFHPGTDCIAKELIAHDRSYLKFLPSCKRGRSAHSEIFLGLLGGAANTHVPDEMAYPHRAALYAMNVHTRWLDPQDDARCLAWAREFFQAAPPHAAGGVYINFLNEDEVDRIAKAYGPNYARLKEIKAKYDPGQPVSQ